MQMLFYTSAITFLFLLLLRSQICGNASLLGKMIRNRIHKRQVTFRNNFIQSIMGTFRNNFKKSHTTKITLITIISTLCVAFLLYNYVFFTVPISDSMRPTFIKGDLILMQKYDTEPHEGDIIMFEIAYLGKKNQVITHRIHSITPSGIKTKGDAVSAVDSWTLRPERIYAKAVIIGGQPIVLKSVGYYFLDTQISSTYAKEFGFMQSLVRSGKQLGLLIFVICIVGYLWLSIEDMKKYKKHRRRN